MIIATAIFLHILIVLSSYNHCNAENTTKITVRPFQTAIVWAVLNEDTKEFVLNSEVLPEPITDIRAFAYDTLRITFIFSGGDPNKLISYNRELHKFDIIADDVGEITSMDTGKEIFDNI